ncbi:MAG: D-2-hydroxyacid dehydrogenase [Bryobacteraceae bacterium]|nr:D-2-hydroxyacid dehydrogenase [Bryobacteraceae bacterium]MDW8378668.1 D-2-hydroxyacid dehydrogenase [Bryobacterales bacterium]
MKLVVLDGYCLNPGDLSWEPLCRLADVTIYDRTPAGAVIERIGEAELVMTNKTPLSAAVFSALPNLKFVGVLATGYNIVDVEAARQHGVVVSNVPTYGTASVAQHAVALLLELCHQVGLHAQAVRNGEWSANPDWCFWKSPLVELAGKTLGVVGFGRIGRQTAKIAHAMGMRVIACDAIQTDPPEYENFRWASLEELLAESDVVSLHCPLTAETQGLINRERLRQMKPAAFLINTSRGGLTVDQDLADALNEGVIAGAGLDVLSVEPPVGGNPLFSAKNCIVTPHIAWATKEARGRLMEIAAGNLRAFLEGKPQNVVS